MSEIPFYFILKHEISIEFILTWVIISTGWGLVLGYPTILIPGLQGKSSDNSTSEADFELTENEISWIGSINLLCVPIGSLTSGLFMEPIGKRRMMQVKIQKNKREKKTPSKYSRFS